MLFLPYVSFSQFVIYFAVLLMLGGLFFVLINTSLINAFNLNIPSKNKYRLSTDIVLIALAIYPIIFLLRAYFSTMWLYFTQESNDVSLIFQYVIIPPAFLFCILIASFFSYLKKLQRTKNRMKTTLNLTLASTLIWVGITALCETIFYLM